MNQTQKCLTKSEILKDFEEDLSCSTGSPQQAEFSDSDHISDKEVSLAVTLRKRVPRESKETPNTAIYLDDGNSTDLSSPNSGVVNDPSADSDHIIGKEVSLGVTLRKRVPRESKKTPNTAIYLDDSNYSTDLSSSSSDATSSDNCRASEAITTSSDNSDSDESYPPKKKNKSSKYNHFNIRGKFPNKLTETSTVVTSAFETQRRKNIEERMRFFKELDLDQAKKDLEDTIRNPKKIRVVNQESNQVRQRSSRIRAKQTEKLQGREVLGGHKDNSYNQEMYKKLDTNKKMPMSDTIFNPFNNADFTDYFQRLNGKLYDKNSLKSDVDLRHCSMDKFQSKMGSLTLRVEQNMKLLPSHITSLKFHPSQSAMLIAAGGKSGTVGLWNVNVEAGDWDDSNIIVFELHSSQVNCVTFSNNDPDVFFTSSNDGNLYKGNLNHKTFQLLYSSTKKSPIYYHSEQNLHTLFVAQDGGEVTRIDTRMECNREEVFRCHHDTIRTLCASPTSRHQMLTCSDDANVSLWDLRVMTKQGLSGRLWNFTLDSGVVSAFLSPGNGTRVLVTLPSNTVCIYDTQCDGGTPFRSWEVQQGGTKSSRPAIYPFKAMWHPQREDFFCIGRNSPPYGVDVFRCNYSMGSFSAPRSSVQLETQRCTLAEFHPSYPALATSSSTNVHLFL